MEAKLSFLIFKRKTHILFLTLFLLLYTACASTDVPTLKEAHDCNSSIEGFFHSFSKWSGEKPALILNENPSKIILGKINHIQKEGVYFDQNKESIFYDSGEKFISFDKIKMLIGENGELIYGKIPDEYSEALSLEIRLVQDYVSDKEQMQLVLKPNAKFSFCLNAGTYTVKEINFVDYKGNKSEVENFHNIKIFVSDKCSNYLGDLYLGFDDLIAPNTVSIPYKFIKKPNHSYLTMGAMYGAIGGAISGAMSALATKEVKGEHKFTVKFDESFKKEGKWPLKVNLLQVNKYNFYPN